jgi:hypothetical protein
MYGFKSPIEAAYDDALRNRALSVVYFVLNNTTSVKERRAFRKEWLERGSYYLVQLLRRCASADWESYPETFWISAWASGFLREAEDSSLRYAVDEWLKSEPLPPLIDEDPQAENRKVKDLYKLFSALNR